MNEHPKATQREVAEHLGVSLGKINYCLRALVERGLVKMRNFRDSNRKIAYAYFLTPNGIDEKLSLTARFLRLKVEEYNALSREIERLHRELAESGTALQNPAPTRVT